MRKAKRLAKAKKLVVKNLTYLRLKNDLAIIENEINSNQPVEKETSSSGLGKIINGFVTEIANNVRRKAVVDLSVEKKTAPDNLAS